MKQLLYITAHPKDETESYSMAVGKAFIDSYRKFNPDDEIIHLDLYKENIPHIDLDVFNGWGKLQAGEEFEKLTKDEKEKIRRMDELCEQFIAADKYVFVTPMWNLSFPPVVKAYIDCVSVAGKTFQYTEKGPIGLLTNKKGLHIQARGGFYSSGPASEMEMGHRFLKIIMGFFGVPNFQGLFVEGHNALPSRAQEIKERAIAQARKLAETF